MMVCLVKDHNVRDGKCFVRQLSAVSRCGCVMFLNG